MGDKTRATMAAATSLMLAFALSLPAQAQRPKHDTSESKQSSARRDAARPTRQERPVIREGGRMSRPPAGSAQSQPRYSQPRYSQSQPRYSQSPARQSRPDYSQSRPKYSPRSQQRPESYSQRPPREVARPPAGRSDRPPASYSQGRPDYSQRRADRPPTAYSQQHGPQQHEPANRPSRADQLQQRPTGTYPGGSGAKFRGLRHAVRNEELSRAPAATAGSPSAGAIPRAHTGRGYRALHATGGASPAHSGPASWRRLAADSSRYVDCRSAEGAAKRSAVSQASRATAATAGEPAAALQQFASARTATAVEPDRNLGAPDAAAETTGAATGRPVAATVARAQANDEDSDRRFTRPASGRARARARVGQVPGRILRARAEHAAGDDQTAAGAGAAFCASTTAGIRASDRQASALKSQVFR